MSNEDNLKNTKGKSKNMAFKELSIIKNMIFWVDSVKKGENQNNVIFARPFNNKDATPQQLTSPEFDIRSNFHGYGGKSYKCLEVNQKFYLIWIDQRSKAIWFQIFAPLEIIDRSSKKYLIQVEEKRQISKSMDVNFDSSFVITEKNLLYGICEIRNRDYLFSVNLKKTNQEINKIIKFDNFAGDLSSNTSFNLLSWIEWDTPYMPWEKNDLFFAQIDYDGVIKKRKKFSNKLFNSNKKISFFQPYWISDNILVCSEDSSGWWNLLFIDVSQINKIIIKKRVKRELVEYGSPQWVSGISFFSGSIKNLFCLAKKENIWILERYQDLQLNEEFKLPFSSISDFTIFDKKVAFKGYGYNFLEHLIEIDFEKNISSNFFKKNSIEYIKEYSKPQSFWFKGFDDQPTHSFLYKPSFNRFRPPPLLLRAHSGPTACFDGTYNSEVQYWTAKGFFVVEVNYGGSSGFGRKYRERLNYKWGIVDSYDCKALVIELLKLRLVDRDKIAILGNSAGGLTALNSLCYEEIFKAAICKYPVIDLKDMYQNTHRFEKDYLNSLVGNYELYSNDYNSRSPINKIINIKKPILLFHGTKDSVISYKQTLKIQEKLIQNNEYSEVIFFENEGHGFKNIDNKKKVIQKTEEFLNKVFNI
tara:strand:- start:1196 stop:3124 length:1929 start_codon:yes stop_codon:yes gene_type:complete